MPKPTRKPEDHIAIMEGYKVKAYFIGGGSGMTIANGIDLKFQTVESLVALGIPRAKAKEWKKLGVFGKTKTELLAEKGATIATVNAKLAKVTIADTDAQKKAIFKNTLAEIAPKIASYKGKMSEESMTTMTSMQHFTGNAQDPTISTLTGGAKRKNKSAWTFKEELDKIIKEKGFVTDEDFQEALETARDVSGGVSTKGTDKEYLSPKNRNTFNREITKHKDSNIDLSYVKDYDGKIVLNDKGHPLISTSTEGVNVLDKDEGYSATQAEIQTQHVDPTTAPKKKLKPLPEPLPEPVVVNPVTPPVVVNPVTPPVVVKEKNTTPQQQIVLGPNGEEIMIPIGEDVSESDLRGSEKGEQTYDSWNELEKNMDNFDKDLPFYIGEGAFKKRYKWNKEKDQVQLVDKDGGYLADDVQVNNRELNDIFRENPIQVKGGRDQEGPSNQEIIENEIVNPSATTVVDEEVLPVEEPQEEGIGDVDADGNGVPDYLENPVDDTEKGKDKKSKSIGGIGKGLLQGGAALLDSIGGPGAIISYVMGKKGLKEAMKEVKPHTSAQLSPMFMQHLRQSRELAKKGFHPDEARAMQKEMDGAYQMGLENAVRGSGGQRATFLAQSGVLDSQRSSALIEYAAKDADLQRKNADKYEKLIMFKENFDIQQTEKERAEDMANQVANKQAAAEFTSAAFTNVMAGLGGGASSLLNKQMGSPKQFFSNIEKMMNNTGTTGTNE